MFCPSCGAETSEGLSYCKRCGARLAGATAGEPRPRVAGLIWAVAAAIVLITLGGLTVILGFLLKVGAFASGAMMVVFGLLLLVVLAVDILLARQLSRLLGFHLHGSDGARAGQLPPAVQPSAQLEAPRPPALGELEQTTRTLGDHEQATRVLDPAPREREPR